MDLKKAYCALLALGFFCTLTANAEDYPTYIDGTLTIPRIDTEDQAGQYQHATFTQTGGNTWELTAFDERHTNSVLYGLVVNVIQTEDLPIQVFLDVQGSFRDGCGRFGQISQRLVNNKFEVKMYTARNPLVEQGLVGCTMALAPFRKVIQLNTYGLIAGTYSYDINGMAGTFELSEENKLPDNLLPAPDPSVFPEVIIVLPE